MIAAGHFVRIASALPFLFLRMSAASAVSQSETAMAMARSGQVDEAIRQLRALQASGNTDPDVSWDLVVLLQQKGRAADAVALYEKAGPAQPPGQALLAATRAYRDLKQFDQAAALARAGLKRFPGEAVWPIQLALILGDQNKTDEALVLLGTPAARGAPENDRLLAQAYVERRAARPFEALRAYLTLLQREPDNAEAREAAAAILREIRAPWAAARLQAQRPLGLSADMAAAEVRWDPLDTPDPRRRFDAADRAIGDLDGLIARSQAEGNAALTTQLRLDRIVAYRDRVRMADAIAEAEALRKAGVALPPFARQAYADALLYMRQPKAARAEYEAVLQADPDNRDAKIALVYAAVEMEDFAAAYAMADDLLKNAPVWQRFHGDPGSYPGEDFVDALLLAASVRYFGDEPGEAWKRLAPERDAAPRNPFIRSLAATVMQGRNWPRAAEQEYRIALGMAPSLLEARTGLAETELGRNQIAQAREDLAALSALYPENTAIRKLDEQFSAATGWQLEAELRPSHESGGGEFGNAGDELKTSFTVHSPLIADNWRLFGGYSYANSHPPEGFVDLKRITGGAQVILPDFDASMALTRNVSKVSRYGFAGMADWMPSDQMTFAMAGEVVSSETPLRAFLHGITADLASTRFTYAWDEASNASVGLGWMPFSDGNRRVTVDARYEQKVLASPHFGLTIRGELYGSTNSIDGAPYYNPKADGSATVNILAEHVLWRRYEDSLVQAITLNGGWYGQQDFRGGAIGTATYEQRWRFDPRTELVYGISYGKRLYDGAYARETGAFITLREKL